MSVSLFSTAGQEADWRKITESVHAAGGRIFTQLFRTGRISHPAQATPIIWP